MDANGKVWCYYIIIFEGKNRNLASYQKLSRVFKEDWYPEKIGKIRFFALQNEVFLDNLTNFNAEMALE